MVWLLSGCFLFITADEHRARVAALSDTALTGTDDTGTDDTGTDDTGTDDTDEPTPYAGSYDGPVSINVDMPGDSECTGDLEIYITPSGEITGSGSCSFAKTSFSDLDVEVVGQVDGDQAAGEIRVNTSIKDSWTGRFFTSGSDNELRGEFSGTINISGFERDYEGSFVVD